MSPLWVECCSLLMLRLFDGLSDRNWCPAKIPYTRSCKAPCTTRSWNVPWTVNRSEISPQIWGPQKLLFRVISRVEICPYKWHYKWVTGVISFNLHENHGSPACCFRFSYSPGATYQPLGAPINLLRLCHWSKDLQSGGRNGSRGATKK